MRVHRITVRDVRAVTERTVHLPDSGVVVVEGPNEIGKSTLLEAFDRLLELKSTSSSARVRALQPIGRDVGPFVEAEFTVAGRRVRVAKRWLRSPLTELEVLSPDPEQLTGSAAQARLEQLLTGVDTTLWEALRFTQSGDGTVVPLVSSGVLREALDGAADARLHDDGGERVLDLVEEEYLRYFTARTGRPSGAYRAAIADHTEAQGEVAEAHRRLVEAEGLLERHARAGEDVELADARRTAARAELADAQARHQAVAALESTLREVTSRCRETEGRAGAADGALASRRRQVAEVDTLRAGVEQLQQQLADLTEQAHLLDPVLRDAHAAVEQAEVAGEQADARLDRARADRELLADRDRVTELEQRLEDVRRRGEVVARDRAALPDVSVTQQHLHHVDRLVRELAVLEAQHEAASPRVEVQSLGTTAQVKGRHDRRAVEVDWAEAQSFVATDDLEITVPGAVRVRVTSAADAEQRLTSLAAARVAVNTALYDLGCRTLEEVVARARETQEAHDRLRESTRDLESLLVAHGTGSAEDLQATLAGGAPTRLLADVERARARVDAATERRSLGEEPPSVLPRDGEDARRAEQEAADEVRRCREARRAAAEALSEGRTRQRELGARADRFGGRLHGERERLSLLVEALRAAREETSDEDLERHAHRLAEELADARTEQQTAQQAVIRADVDGLRERWAVTQREAARAEDAAEVAREILHTLNGQVELAASEGRQELYDLAEADLAEAERRLAGLDRRARAVRHLRGTLHQHRDAAHRAYVRPFTEALEGLGRQVYGDTFGVGVDEDLSVRSRTVDGTTVPFDQLSGGAKEQLGILARLAVAHLVDPQQGVPVVIDDALGYSDPERLAQMGRVLGSEAAVGEDVQVILLTCTPQRYAAIPNVHTIRLTA
ncbi:AAA family ATPase [Ornithinimicrobium sp. LYQ92]|uniref:AAA family ATPase n=1 Tax=Serinicoccus sp. LYQ92 TaxID=3378798 RepID=UPI0038545E8B